MARTSLRDVVQWLKDNGYSISESTQPGEKYRVTEGESQFTFANGTKLVQWVRKRMEENGDLFDIGATTSTLNETLERKDELERKMRETKDKDQSMLLYREAHKLEPKIAELEVLIKNKGRLYTPNRVKNCLKAEGLEYRETHTTAVKGWHDTTGDFYVEVNWKDREVINVLVTYCGPFEKETARIRRKNRIVKALRDWHFEVLSEEGDVIKINRVIKGQGCHK